MTEIVLDGITAEIHINVKYPTVIPHQPMVIGTWRALFNGNYYGDAIEWNQGAGPHEWYEKQLYEAAIKYLKKVRPNKQSKLDVKIRQELVQTQGYKPIPSGQDKEIRGPLTTRDLDE